MRKAIVGILGCTLLLWGCQGMQEKKPAAAKPAAAKPAAAAPAAPAAAGTGQGITPPSPAPAQVSGQPKEAVIPDKVFNFTKQDYLDIKALSRSKAVVLTFMNTSCNACRQEMDLLNQNYKDLSKSVSIYAVSEDFNPEQQLPKYFQIFPYPFDFIADRDFSLAKGFGITFTPATVVIKNGKVVYQKSGFASYEGEELLKQLKSF